MSAAFERDCDALMEALCAAGFTDHAVSANLREKTAEVLLMGGEVAKLSALLARVQYLEKLVERYAVSAQAWERAKQDPEFMTFVGRQLDLILKRNG